MKSNENFTNSGWMPESSLRIRKKKMKLIPAILWISLAYTVFHEKSSQIGTPVIAAESNTGEGQLDNDLISFDNLDSEEPLDSHRPAHQGLDKQHDDKDEIHTNSVRMPPDIIVVAAVDGTLAGISKQTGRILWKQSEDMSSSQSSSSSLMKPPNKSLLSDTGQILKPLVSTTTTTKSAAGATYKAVPSVDGTIYTTTNDMTITSSVKDLVVKSPFLDPRGRFYVGSRYASAVALDSETGQVLRIISATGKTTGDDESQNESLPSLDDRNVVWIGRVDHEVSIQDAKTGMIDAQFSVGEVMSVADMRGLIKNDGWKPEQIRPNDSPLQQSSVMASSSEGVELPSALIATPNGNVALWNFEDDRFAWVADESFDSPIAYALDAATGLIMGVDIIPDVPDPSASLDDLTREMERQSEMVSLTNTPVVGAMSNGQLYALPLRRKRTSSFGKLTSSATPAISSTSSMTAAALSGNSAKHTAHTVSQLPARSNANLHHNENANQHQQPFQHRPDYNSGKHGVVVAKKACVSTSSAFPSCLVESRSDQKMLPDTVSPLSDGNSQQPDLSHAVATTNFQREDGGFIHPIYGYVSPQDLGGFVHPTYGYVSARDLYGTQKRTNKNSYQRLFRVLGSWLPPTIALIFVLSFELGRRKRLKDEKEGHQNPFLEADQKGAINGVFPLNQNVDSEQRVSEKLHRQEVISVSEDVLGYGGHGTVVYRGVLDGRDVAVKRMLKAYHASADREISLLIESDGDPNVVRYFLKEVRGDFVYLALELCDLSLHELIGVLREKLYDENNTTSLSSMNDEPHVLPNDSIDATKRILLQIASGVKHLHSLRIVHRDLKPAVSICSMFVSNLILFQTIEH